MSATIPCVPCCATQQIVDVPGSPGLNGADGAAGLNAFTTLAGTSPVGDITIPAVGAPVAAPFIVVADNSWAVIGQYIFISDGDAGHMGTFLVTATTGTTVIQATFVGPAANVGNVIHSSSGTVSPAKVTPSGIPGAAVADPLPIANGGTGSASAPAAARALTTTYRLLGSLKNADFNSTGDQAITGLPSKYIVRRIVAQNASVNMTTAAGGIYTGAGKTGTILVAAAQVYTALTAAAKWKDLTIDVTAGGPTTDVLTATTVFFALTTAQGAPATGDIYIWGEDLA